MLYMILFMTSRNSESRIVKSNIHICTKICWLEFLPGFCSSPSKTLLHCSTPSAPVGIFILNSLGWTPTQSTTKNNGAETDLPRKPVSSAMEITCKMTKWFLVLRGGLGIHGFISLESVQSSPLVGYGGCWICEATLRDVRNAWHLIIHLYIV